MRSQNAASPSLATNPVGSDGLLVLSGYGVRVAVERRHLVIRDGFPSERRESRLSRATCGLKRLVVLGHSGTVSLEALRWIQDVGAAFVHIDADGTVVTASTAPALNDSRLRRAQALAGLDERGYAIAKELIRIKIEGQRAVLSAIDPESHEYGAIDDALRALAEAADLDSIRLFEANAAAAYWRAWSPIEVRFARNHLPRIPAHWQRFGARGSAVTGASPRRASNPANALLNYLYAILEAETRIALLTLGLDPGMGVLHADQRGRDSLALDVMEAARPAADRMLLDLLQSRVFRAADFHEMRDGTCRLVSPMPEQVVGSADAMRREIAPVAERIASMLSGPNPTSSRARALPSPLTESNRSQGRKSVAGRPRAKISRKRVRVSQACRICGQGTSSKTVLCADCRPTQRSEAGEHYGKKALERLAERRREGKDPTKSPDALRKQGRTSTRNRLLELEWDRTHLERPDPETFVSEILPRLQGVPLRAISAATGLSLRYSSMIRRGEYVPHPRHWRSLSQSAASSLGADEV
ncbi:MAG: CRISPR-associated endonuclease Cas1 [Dehalococcoidia bacterium]